MGGTVAVLCTALLFAPWIHAINDPLCLRDDCPGPQRITLPGYRTAGPFVAAIAVGAAIILAFDRIEHRGQHAMLATLLFAAGAALAWFEPQGLPGFAWWTYDGRAWGSVLAAALSMIGAGTAFAHAMWSLKAKGVQPDVAQDD